MFVVYNCIKQTQKLTNFVVRFNVNKEGWNHADSFLTAEVTLEINDKKSSIYCTRYALESLL